MGNAFAKKSSGGGDDGSKDKGGGSSGGDKGGGSGGGGSGSSDNGGGGSDTGGGSSDTGSTSTPPSTTAEPPAATEGSTPPPPPAAENQKTTCPDGTTVDPTSTCPTPPTTEETTPPPAASQQTCPDGTTVDPTTGACPTTTTEQNTAPPAPTDQTCPGGSTQDPMTGVCSPTSEGAPPTNTPPGQSTANMLTGGIQTAAPIKSPPPPPSSEPFEGCPGHVTRNANGVCLSPLSKDSPCAEGFHHDASGKCVDNTLPLADGTCAGGYSLENVDGKNTCNGKGVGPCPGNVARDANGVCFDLRPNTPCAQGFHRDTVINGGKCVDNGIPYAGSCELGWHMVSLTGMCARNDVLLPDGTCYAGHHLVTRTTAQGKKLYNCYPNEFPLSSGTCAKGWYFVAAWNGCMPGLPVQSGGKCPQGYHKTLMNVKDKDNLCAADPDTLTKLTTQSQPNQPPSQTGGGSTGMGTPPTQTGGKTTTPTTPPTSTTTTTTTNVINRGGSSGGGSTSTNTAPPAQTTNNFLTYVNAINKISIKYPSTWTKTELIGNPSIPVMFNAPTTAATTAGAKTNFVISITPRATNIDSFTLQQINGLIQSKTVKYTITDTNAKVLTPPTSITSFRELSYDAMKNDNVPLKGAAILFVNGGTGYSLLYLAKQTEYTQNLPMVQQMINSFQVGGGSSAPVQNVAAAAGVTR